MQAVDVSCEFNAFTAWHHSLSSLLCCHTWTAYIVEAAGQLLPLCRHHHHTHYVTLCSTHLLSEFEVLLLAPDFQVISKCSVSCSESSLLLSPLSPRLLFPVLQSPLSSQMSLHPLWDCGPCPTPPVLESSVSGVKAQHRFKGSCISERINNSFFLSQFEIWTWAWIQTGTNAI